MAKNRPNVTTIGMAAPQTPQIHVSLVAVPDCVMSTLGGIYDTLTSFPAAAALDKSVPASPPFSVEIVSESDEAFSLANGLPMRPHRSVADVAKTDAIIVPSLLVPGKTWRAGRYPATVGWLNEMHGQGSLLCSACSGIFLLGETGLFRGMPATVHWAFEQKFRETYPDVPVEPQKSLVISGERDELISSGASTSWHDLVLHLITRHVGAAAALGMARYFALEWHREGLAPFIVFSPPRDHGDTLILDCQNWIERHFSVASPVDEMTKRSGLNARTFKRRFRSATGMPPIAYVQKLRVEKAKRQLETSSTPVDEISWQVGYEDAAFFRRLFKRSVAMTPGAYRKKFRLSPAE